MKIQLSDEEFGRIAKYTNQLGGIRQQIQQLQNQGNEIVDVINTSWLAGNQREKLDNEELREVDIPAMIDEQVQLVVVLNPKDKTAEWQSAHDVKRFGNPEEVEAETTEETSDENPE